MCMNHSRERERENGYFEPMVYKNQGYPGFLPKGTLNHQEWKFDIVGYRWTKGKQGNQLWHNLTSAA